jgi:hypothetical protein
LGDAGILDYQDRDFGQFMGGGKEPASQAPKDREFLALLHKIVLKSLLRYITHPRLEMSQRERAAEAASKLWLAFEGRAAPHYVAVDDASWSPVSPHEPARRR